VHARCRPFSSLTVAGTVSKCSRRDVNAAWEAASPRRHHDTAGAWPISLGETIRAASTGASVIGQVVADGASPGKAALRRTLLNARAQLPPASRIAGAGVVCRTLADLPPVASAQSVLGYAAFGSELVIDALLETLLARGTAVHLPWVDGDQLQVARVADLAKDLTPGWRGVREPATDRRRPVAAAIMDVVVAPGVGFDRNGRRLGYGGGHFDRLLARLRPGAVVVGVAFDEQMVDMVPTEAHDRTVDLVVTPTLVTHVAKR
jgi:5-formyltetrahydrofolate cyclo-ligase